MDKLEDLEKAYHELGKKIQDLKNPKIVFDVGKNYGLSHGHSRYVLAGRGETGFAWHKFSGCEYTYDKLMKTGQEAIDRVIKEGLKVIELESNQEAVAKFLLGEGVAI